MQLPKIGCTAGKDLAMSLANKQHLFAGHGGKYHSRHCNHQRDYRRNDCGGSHEAAGGHASDLQGAWPQAKLPKNN